MASWQRGLVGRRANTDRQDIDERAMTLVRVPSRRTRVATKTPPQHHFCVMTRIGLGLYPLVVMKGLQQTTAFVIQFRCTAEDDLKKFPGRVEHVASGRTGTFESIEELPQLLLKLLKCACPGQSE